MGYVTVLRSTSKSVVAADRGRAQRTREGAERGVGAPANDRARVWGGAPP
jgi:hypothetical protein